MERSFPLRYKGLSITVMMMMLAGVLYLSGCRSLVRTSATVDWYPPGAHQCYLINREPVIEVQYLNYRNRPVRNKRIRIREVAVDTTTKRNVQGYDLLRYSNARIDGNKNAYLITDRDGRARLTFDLPPDLAEFKANGICTAGDHRFMFQREPTKEGKKLDADRSVLVTVRLCDAEHTTQCQPCYGEQ